MFRCPPRVFISPGIKSLIIPAVDSDVRNWYTKLQIDSRWEVTYNMMQRQIKAIQWEILSCRNLWFDLFLFLLYDFLLPQPNPVFTVHISIKMLACFYNTHPRGCSRMTTIGGVQGSTRDVFEWPDLRRVGCMRWPLKFLLNLNYSMILYIQNLLAFQMMSDWTVG